MATRIAETDRVISRGDDDIVTTRRESNCEVRRRRIPDHAFYCIRIDDLG